MQVGAFVGSAASASIAAEAELDGNEEDADYVEMHAQLLEAAEEEERAIAEGAAAAAPAAPARRRRNQLLTYYVCTFDGCGWSGSTRARHTRCAVDLVLSVTL